MKTLADLKAAGLPHATCETIGLKISSDDDQSKADAAIATANEYLAVFLPPNDEGTCVQCDALQGGIMASFVGTGFQFGFAHGEGKCGTCGYPGRAVHQIGGVGRLSNFILQYHPDGLEAPIAAPDPVSEEATA